MKRFINKFMCAFAVVLGLAAFTSCSDDEWGDNNSEYENVFIVAFADNWTLGQNHGNKNNGMNYNVTQGETQAVPVNLFCKDTRSFDAEAFVYVANTTLQKGVDFDIVDEFGYSLPQNADGSYTLTYDLNLPEEMSDHHRTQNIYVKTIAGGTKGTLELWTFDPADVDANGKIRLSDGGTAMSGTVYTPNNVTAGQYEVHCVTTNYKVKVTIK